MKPAIGILSFLALVQIIYSVMMFDKIVHGEVAWRMLTCGAASCAN